MSINPRDLQRAVQQAQKLQQELASAQDALATQVFEGSSGGGVVRARVTGSGELTEMRIDPSVIDPDDPDLLADLVIAAVNQAQKSAQQAAEEQLGGLSGDLGGLLG